MSKGEDHQVINTLPKLTLQNILILKDTLLSSLITLYSIREQKKIFSRFIYEKMVFQRSIERVARQKLNLSFEKHVEGQLQGCLKVEHVHLM